MKILQLCKKFPYPVKDGESLAILNLSKALAGQGAEIVMLAMNTLRHAVDVNLEAESLRHYSAIHTLSVDNRIKAGAAFRNLFSRESYHISRFVDEGFEKKLTVLLKAHTFDLIQLETLYLTPYIPIIRRHSSARIALRSHNVEFEIWERIVKNTRPGLKKWYLAHLTKKLKRYEIGRLQTFDLLIAITERDRKRYRQLGYQGKDITVPIGLTINQYEPDWEALSGPLHLAFIGSLDWMPNVEGLKWFLEKVWPELKNRWPGLSFHIAGRNTPAWLQRLKMDGVEVHGEVPDARRFINDFPVMVAPLLSGSGMRVKIIEGMALGRVIMTTSLGLEGIPATHGEEVLIADNPDEFVKGLEWLEREQLAPKMGLKARGMIEKYFDNQRIGQELLHAYDHLTTKKV